MKVGDKIIANVTIKYVPYLQKKQQEVTILEIRADNLIMGRTARGKIVHFTKEDIINQPD